MLCRNSKGYETAKIFNSKFTHLSPVWYDLKRYISVPNACSISRFPEKVSDISGFYCLVAKEMDWFWKGDIMLIRDGSKSFDQEERLW